MGNVDFRSGTLSITEQLFLPNASQYAPLYPAAVIYHGMGSRKESHSAIADWMAQHGLAALCFDFVDMARGVDNWTIVRSRMC